jgi:hypothetical protein
VKEIVLFLFVQICWSSGSNQFLVKYEMPFTFETTNKQRQLLLRPPEAFDQKWAFECLPILQFNLINHLFGD